MVSVFGRVPLARRQVMSDLRPLVVSVIGIGAALGLILILQGLWVGFQAQISSYEDNVGADLFVGAPGTQNFLGDTSVVPASMVSTVRAVPGVERADAVTARGLVLDMDGRKQFAFMIASEPGGMGGPWRLQAGRLVTADDEVVVDQSLADQHGLGLGDRIEVLGSSLRIVGLSAGTRSWMSSFVFVSPTAAEALLRSRGAVSYVLVRAADPGTAAADIERRSGLAALTPEALGANDRRLLSKIMGGPLNLMVGVAFIAGTLIVALTVYSAVVERLREYGIAKAMGASRARQFGIVLGQTSILTALGAVAGWAVYEGGSRLIAWLRPQFWVQLSAGAVVTVAAAAVLMAVLAAVVPTLRLVRLDPASVYRG
ncbi:MAG: ABC transporter permease [Intrasporangium sp.]|uniref:ABC transporter permease n=1 Tax=Intrasporangium sp. TaxID=1925024 RepID=UPI00264A3BC1|nr:ABC transporter permease [Intrasporangium sp.]MDN5798013.1 ABC transporter permease [Intrasporangium sp.]